MKIEFEIPKGFVPPESTGDEGEFDLVCTFKPEGENKLCLVKLGDTALDAEEDDEEEEGEREKEPGYRDMADEMASQSFGGTEAT